MTELIHEIIGTAVSLIEAVGATVLVYGVVRTMIQFVMAELPGGGKAELDHVRSALRVGLGFYLLLGLELLIAADIMETMIEPDWQSLGVLGGISLIRILTGFALSKELEHERDRSVRGTSE